MIILSLLMISQQVAGSQPAAAPQPRATPVAATPAPADKLICKRWADIGSLVPNHKECHTRAEWTRMAENARSEAQEAASRRVSGGSLDQ